jgi:Resolvase, N terminal domain
LRARLRNESLPERCLSSKLLFLSYPQAGKVSNFAQCHSPANCIEAHHRQGAHGGAEGQRRGDRDKLDRLGRSTRELLKLIDRIGNAGASFQSLGDPLWDTSSPKGRLLSTLLAAIAEFERELIRERTGEGRRRAMAKWVKLGRKPKLSRYQRAEAIKRRAAGETLASIAKTYAVDLSMISRL